MKRILLSLLVIGAVAALISGGTLAYFSDTATSTTNTFSAGTLVLKISDNNESYGDTVSASWASPAAWAPGQSVTEVINFKNEGTIGIHELYADWTNLTDPDGLANAIEVTWLSDSTDIDTNNIAPFVAVYDRNHDGKLSLWELVNGDAYYVGSSPSPYEASFYGGIGRLPTDPPVVAPNGGVFTVKMTYKFMESAGNEYQGKSCSFDLNVLGSQVRLNP